MGTTLNSLDNLINSATTKGMWRRHFYASIPATTAANSTSGYISSRRCTNTITVPSMGAGIGGMYLTHFKMTCAVSNSLTNMAGLEYMIATLTVSGY